MRPIVRVNPLANHSEKAQIMNLFEGRNLLIKGEIQSSVNRDLALNVKQRPLQGSEKRLINKETV